jgi:para-aminobenzoate synthetase
MTHKLGPPSLRLARDESQYLNDIAECQRALTDGESYELCLTNKVHSETELAPFDLYRALRRANPAPYAAFLRLGRGLSVLSSSPERFLRIDRDGNAEARPIKGTAARVADPEADAAVAAALAADPKQRAENLMIVDLMRNDLGRVCQPGTVSVPRLMEVESFETVHQLVSTIQGRLRPDAGPVDAVRAAFPPGSMTGAPKERTMAILDRLEGEARGVYAGAIGYFGLGGGADLAVAIRTLVLDGEGNVETGAGGAIVAASDPAAEFEEMLLKAWAPLRALEPGAPRAYSRSRFSDSGSSRVTPRKSITSGAASTSSE